MQGPTKKIGVRMQPVKAVISFHRIAEITEIGGLETKLIKFVSRLKTWE